MQSLDTLQLVSLAAALGWASGIRLYVVLFVVGLVGYFNWLPLPSHLGLLAHPMVLAASGGMVVVEFVADKVPWFDSVWDSIHTFIRIPAGAALAAGVFGDAGAASAMAAAIIGGSLAAGSHVTKAGTRAIANTSPEPFSNWGLSFGEDVAVGGGLLLALTQPWVFLALLLPVVLLMLWLTPKLWRAARGMLRRLKAGRALPAASQYLPPSAQEGLQIMATPISTLLNRRNAQQAPNTRGFHMNSFGFKGVIFVAIALLALVTVLGSFYTIDSGKVGVIQTFGRYQDVISQPGLHWKRPFIDTVLEKDVKLQTATYSGLEDGEDGDGIINKPHLDVLDAKNVSYDIELSVMFTPVAEKMPEILSTYGENYFDKKINPIVRDVVRDVGGKYSVESIADHRDAINSEIRTRLVEEYKTLPFIFGDAALRKLQLPENIMQKIVGVQEAKQEEERLKIINRQAEQNKQITITNAQAEKEKIIIAAQADAESTLTRAKAQAEANERISQSLTPLLVKQNQVEKWSGQVPTVQSGEGTGLLFNMGEIGK